MSHVAGEAKSVQHGQQVKEGLVFRVVCPTLDGHAIRCRWSVAGPRAKRHAPSCST